MSNLQQESSFYEIEGGYCQIFPHRRIVLMRCWFRGFGFLSCWRKEGVWRCDIRDFGMRMSGDAVCVRVQLVAGAVDRAARDAVWEIVAVAAHVAQVVTRPLAVMKDGPLFHGAVDDADVHAASRFFSRIDDMCFSA